METPRYSSRKEKKIEIEEEEKDEFDYMQEFIFGTPSSSANTSIASSSRPSSVSSVDGLSSRSLNSYRSTGSETSRSLQNDIEVDDILVPVDKVETENKNLLEEFKKHRTDFTIFGISKIFEKIRESLISEKKLLEMDIEYIRNAIDDEVKYQKEVSDYCATNMPNYHDLKECEKKLSNNLDKVSQLNLLNIPENKINKKKVILSPLEKK